MRARPDRRLSWAVVLTLLALVGSIAIAGFFHRDDGCAIERHCAACVSALHMVAGAQSVVLALPASRRAVELAIPLTEGHVSSGIARLHTSRGPPAA